MNMAPNFLIAKFGTLEHLEQLQKGKIFFNTICTYRNDGTDYRGDALEGRIPIDPTKVNLYDTEGKDIFETLPRPDTLYMSLLGDENIMMFCAVAITTEIMDNVRNNIWLFKDEFKTAIQNFGEYVMLLWSVELLKNIELATDETGQKIGYDSGLILYRNLEDFENTDEYRKTGSPLDRYFVKGLTYKNQNEWRVIIGGEKELLTANCGKGFLLTTVPFKYCRIMKTTELLNGEIEIGTNNSIHIRRVQSD